MSQIKVNLGKRSYSILISGDLLENIGSQLLQYHFTKNCLLVSNSIVFQLYGKVVKNSLEGAGFKVTISLVDDGEQTKSLEWAAKLYNDALAAELDRNSPIIALGGGVIGDLTGFVAATYMRGIPFVQLPTTLLAQVDSSIGGKVAINHSKGKNLIGAFYQPKIVFIDLRTLKTLPIRELRAGLAEVIKYGVIWDKAFFEFLEQNIGDVFALNNQVLEEIVAKSCAIKATIVEQDENEKDLRTILNFGHTFGHTYESLTNYAKYRHGEAVAMGMVEATKFAQNKGLANPEIINRLTNLLLQVKLQIKPTEDFSPLELMEIIKHDKKNQAGCIQLILPQQLGKVKKILVKPKEIEAYLER